ncbi:MAG: hypothetical protein POELPBGB_03619 [Bacteroidia bacterium]|nr:hypothetical protein [Bacteroidia bacterium]
MKYTTIFIFLLIILSCGKVEKLDFADYMNFIENEKSGLNMVKEIADYKIQVNYQPAEYLALKESIDKEKQLSADKFSKALPHYRNHYYFRMRIENKKQYNNPIMEQSGDYDEYAYILEYMSFYAQNDLKLVAGKDTLKCVNYHFENNYKLLPFNDIQMAFKKPQTPVNENLTLIWDDQVYGVGRIKIEFENENINNIPQPIIN